MNKPQISIIVPVFKAEQYLYDCIDSIINQSIENFELILVDDGSPDKSREICDIYALKDNRIKVIHKSNGGQSSARNAGLDIAQGDFITFVDCDDLLAPNSLNILYEEMKRTNADIILGKIIRFTSDGKNRAYTRLESPKIMTGKEALTALLKGTEINISVCGSIYKRNIFDNIRMPIGYICEDWYIMPQIYLQNNIHVIFTPILYYLYRDNEQSTMGMLQKQCNPQILAVAESVITTIKEDKELYYQTLWSNLKRVWKYVGIVYLQNRQKKEKVFLTQTRNLLKKYWHDLQYTNNMNITERIGVWSFCYCNVLCNILYAIKKLYTKI